MRLPFVIGNRAIQGNFDKLVSERDDMAGMLTIDSDDGAALGAVSTASEATYADWTGGPTLTAPETATYAVWTGPVQIAVTTAVLTGARFSLAKNGTIFGQYVRSVGRNQFDESGGAAYEHVDLAAGDVLTLRYATNGQTANFSGTTLYMQRLP